MALDLVKLKSEFIAESADLLDQAENALLATENTFSESQVQIMFRAIHTIKGNSGIFENRPLQQLSHTFEDTLNLWRISGRSFEEPQVDLLLLVIDTLRKLINDIDGNNEKLENEAATLKNKLETLANKPDRQPTVPQPRSGSKQVKSKIKIPSRYLESARKSNENLFVVIIDLLEQNFTDVASFEQEIQKIEANNLVRIFYKEILWKNLVLTIDQEASLPYLMIVSSPERFENTVLPSILKNIKLYTLNSQVQNKPLAAGQEKVISKSPQKASSIRVSIDLLNELIATTSEAVIARNGLVQYIEQTKRDAELERLGKTLSRLIMNMQHSVMKTRLQPVSQLYDRLPRLIRDICNQSGKPPVLLKTTGQEVELDKVILDSLIDPITHILRNAIDHGIEKQDERLRVGKTTNGQLEINARLENGNVIIATKDDGRGLDVEKIRAKALSEKIIGLQEADSMNDQQIFQLIFHPGFSTAQKVTQLSGRGVGMDVVKENLRKVGGAVSVETSPGKGTSIIASFPQTLSVLSCLLIKSSDSLLAIPQKDIKEILRSDKAEIKRNADKDFLYFRGRHLAAVNLAELLELPLEAPPSYSIVVRAGNHEFALLVQEVVTAEEVVIKPLHSELQGLNLYSGGSILGNGNVLLILDTQGIAEKACLNLTDTLEKIEAISRSSSLTKYLVFTACEQTFALPLNNRPKIERILPGEIQTSLKHKLILRKGQPVQLISLHTYYNLPAPQEEPRFALLYSDYAQPIGILASDIIQVCEAELSRATVNGTSTETTIIVENKVIPVIEVEALAKGELRSAC